MKVRGGPCTSVPRTSPLGWSSLQVLVDQEPPLAGCPGQGSAAGRGSVPARAPVPVPQRHGNVSFTCGGSPLLPRLGSGRLAGR